MSIVREEHLRIVFRSKVRKLCAYSHNSSRHSRKQNKEESFTGTSNLRIYFSKTERSSSLIGDSAGFCRTERPPVASSAVLLIWLPSCSKARSTHKRQTFGHLEWFYMRLWLEHAHGSPIALLPSARKSRRTSSTYKTRRKFHRFGGESSLTCLQFPHNLDRLTAALNQD